MAYCGIYVVDGKSLIMPKRLKMPKVQKTYGAVGVAVSRGHRTCVPRGTFPWVPKEMGWLWTARDVPGYKFDPYWRPGAVPRSFFKASRSKTGPYGPTESIKTRKKGQKNAKKSDLGEIDENEMKSTLVVQQKDGQIQVMLKQLKPMENRHVSEYPYDDEVLPYTFKVQGETGDQAKRRKQMKAKETARQREGVCRDAFANICRQVYHKVDKGALHAAAAEQDQCPCLFLQAQIINNLVEMFMDKQGAPSNKEDLSDTFLNQLMKSIMEGEHTVGGCPSKDSISSEEDWRVEFTPPFAKYNPRAKRLVTKDVEVQTIKPKIEGDSPRKVSVNPPSVTDTPMT